MSFQDNRGKGLSIYKWLRSYWIATYSGIIAVCFSNRLKHFLLPESLIFVLSMLLRDFN